MGAAGYRSWTEDANVKRLGPRRIRVRRGVVVAALVTGCLGIGTLLFDPLEVIAGGREVNVVIRAADGDLRKVAMTVRDLGGSVDKRLEKTNSILASIRQDAIDDLWESPVVLAVAHDDADLRIA